MNMGEVHCLAAANTLENGEGQIGGKSSLTSSRSPNKRHPTYPDYTRWYDAAKGQFVSLAIVNKGITHSSTQRNEKHCGHDRRRSTLSSATRTGDENSETGHIYAENRRTSNNTFTVESFSNPEDLILSEVISGPTEDVDLPSTSPFPPSLVQCGNNLDQIIREVMPRGLMNLTFYPHQLPSEKIQFTSMFKIVKVLFPVANGFVYFAESLAMSLNMDEAMKPPKFTCILSDAIVLTSQYPAVILTFAVRSKLDKHLNVTVEKYNISLAREATDKMRNFTDTPFNILSMVIGMDETEVSFKTKLQKLLSDNALRFPGPRLSMSDKKCIKLIKSLLAVVSASAFPSKLKVQKDRIVDEGEERLHVLTREQFSALHVCMLTKQPLRIGGNTGCGAKVLAVELAKRLSHDGETMLVCTGRHESNLFRKLGICCKTGKDIADKPSLCETTKHFVYLERACTRPELSSRVHRLLYDTWKITKGKLVILKRYKKETFHVKGSA